MREEQGAHLVTPGAGEPPTFGGGRGGNVSSLRLGPELCLTLKQPPLLPPTPHHGPLPLIPTRTQSRRERGCPTFETRPMLMTVLGQGFWTGLSLGSLLIE